MCGGLPPQPPSAAQKEQPMAKTSIHLTACDIEGSELHNKRQRPLDYVRSELSHLNQSHNYTGRTLAAELKAIRAEVKEKTGRALQKNAVPIKEGVAVIKETTTMEDLMRFCERCREAFGIIPLQIHVHRDEGHIKSKDWKPNLHAHIVWRMYGENGRNVRISNIDCARMQTILAECLGMERGESSSRKHLSALQYKIEQEEGRAASLSEEVKQLSATKAAKEETIETIKTLGAQVRDTITRRNREALERAEGEISRLKAVVRENEEIHAKMQDMASKAVKRAENEVFQAKMAQQKTKEEVRTAQQEVGRWRKICNAIWPGLVEAINAIVVRCTTAVRSFTQEQAGAIHKALAPFEDQEAAAKDLWKMAELHFPKNTYPEWIREGKEDYFNLVKNQEQQTQQSRKR